MGDIKSIGPTCDLSPGQPDRRDAPEWQAAYKRLMANLRRWRGDGYRVGKITEDDKYDPLPR